MNFSINLSKGCRYVSVQVTNVSLRLALKESPKIQNQLGSFYH